MPGIDARGAGTDRHKQRIFGRTEFFARYMLKLCDIVINIALKAFGQTFSVFIIHIACFGCYCEALGYRESENGHFREVGAFAAKQLTHLSVRF